MSNKEILLEAKDICKVFPGVVALKGVNLNIRKGEVHAIAGENGAGKSTLIKIISGVYRCTRGVILFNGVDITNYSIAQINNTGISTIHQEVDLVKDLSVAENLFLNNLPRKYGLIDYKTLNAQAQKIIQSLDVEIDPREKISELSISEVQYVAIMRCLVQKNHLIIMDEPTSSLSQKEIDKLFEVISSLKAKGMSIIYISHIIEDLLQISDRVTVLRDGQLIKTEDTKNLTRDKIVSYMVGKDIAKYQKTIREQKKDTYFTVKNLSSKKFGFEDIEFSLHSKEVLGFFGLLGSGRTELLNLLYGLEKPDKGYLYLGEERYDLRKRDISKRIKMGMVPEDRNRLGMFNNLSVLQNISCASLDRYKCGVINLKNERDIVSNVVKSLDIKTPSLEQEVNLLSGGNKQKCLVARWLLKNPDVLIMDEPTKGIDVATKTELYNLISDLADKGMSIIIASSEAEEITFLCNSVYILKNRCIIKHLAGKQITKNNLLKTALKGV